MRPRRRSILLRSRRDGFGQTLQRLFHVSRETMSDRFLFLLAAAGAAQNVGLLTLRNRHLLHFHFGPYPRPVVLQQLFFKLLHLATWRSHQILATAFADRR